MEEGSRTPSQGAGPREGGSETGGGQMQRRLLSLNGGTKQGLPSSRVAAPNQVGRDEYEEASIEAQGGSAQTEDDDEGKGSMLGQAREEKTP